MRPLLHIAVAYFFAPHPRRVGSEICKDAHLRSIRSEILFGGILQVLQKLGLEVVQVGLPEKMWRSW
jgi:hypothetical protein